MIDPEVMAQLRALSEEAQGLRRQMELLEKKLDANNANLVRHLEAGLSTVRDAADRAAARVVGYAGKLEDFSDEQAHFKTDFEWWSLHLDELSRRIDGALKRLMESEARLAQDNLSLREWAVARIDQIGRIFRR